MSLMCQGELRFASIEADWSVDFSTYFASELERLQEFQDEGLVVLDRTGIHVTARGWFFVRGIAMVFDRYLQANQNRARFSRIL